MEPLVLTPAQAMEVLQIGRNEIYRMIHTKELRSFRRGRNLKIPRAEVERWVREQYQGNHEGNNGHADEA